MADIVHTTARKLVVRSFNVVSTHVLGFGADGVVNEVGAVGLPTEIDLVEAPVRHVEREFDVVVYGVVVRFDAVCVVDCELRIPGRLYGFVDDAVANAESVHGEESAVHRPVRNHLVLLVEVVEESGTVMAAVALGPEIEFSGFHIAIELR